MYIYLEYIFAVIRTIYNTIMGFFVDNPVIDFIQKIVRKPESILMWLFTGMIVSSTLYLILLPVPEVKKKPKK